MKIQFCDLCNESVPEGDLKSGKAFLRKGRVICAVCDSSMGGGSASSQEPVREDTPAASPRAELPRAAAPETRPKPARARRAAAPGGWAAIVLVLLLGAYIGHRLRGIEERAERSRSLVDGRLREAGRDLDETARRARERDDALRLELVNLFSEELDAVEDSVAATRADLAREAARADALVDQIAALSRVQLDSEQQTGERLDELTARAMKSRDRLEELDDRLRGAELTLASAGAVPAAAAPAAAAPPRYAAELADLASDNAGTRWNAVQALGETGDPAVVAHLAPVLEDPDVFVRMAVARVLGDLAAPEGIEPLIDALEDGEAVVREAAMVALHGITGRNFRFDPVATPADRAKRVKAWRGWWKKAREDYFGES